MLEDIFEMVDTETAAWTNRDTRALLALVHPDMVLVWPRDRDAHDPADWECPMGRFDHQRWQQALDSFFVQYELVHNRRKTVRAVITGQQDGGFAVEDVDTLWQNRQSGEQLHWKGRCCKTYVDTSEGFRMIACTGPLNFGDPNCEECAAQA